MPHAFYLTFFFLLGACVGSFLNVVVWRLPRNESLSHPGSHCPNCNTPLKWYDNMPVLGWIKLGGKCRFCRQPISARYPIVEAVTGLLFVLYYVLFFQAGVGPPSPLDLARPPHAGGGWHWSGTPMLVPDDLPLYLLCMFLVSAMLAASLIDAALFIIPLEIPYYGLFPLAVLFHAAWDKPTRPGALNLMGTGGLPSTSLTAAAAGASLGLAISVGLWFWRKMPQSFPNGEPIFEADRPAMEKEIAELKRKGEEVAPLPPPYTAGQVRREMGKETLFLLPALVGAIVAAVLVLKVEALRDPWERAIAHPWLSGMLGSLLGAMAGGFVVWITRILGTLGFGKLAMGLGDVHLMFAAGAVVGAGPIVVAFFLAPFFGLAVAAYMLLTRKRRELPYGPYLSLATAFVIVAYGPIADWLRPGVDGLLWSVRELIG